MKNQFSKKGAEAILSIIPLTILIGWAGFTFLRFKPLLGTEQAWRFHYSFTAFLLLSTGLAIVCGAWLIYFMLRKKNLPAKSNTKNP
jgi:hypothetical protein